MVSLIFKIIYAAVILMSYEVIYFNVDRWYF